MPYALLADAVLIVHFAVVLFVVGGLPAVLVGNRLGWGWVNDARLRVLHLVAIAVVVVQAWLGEYCFLTHLESWLRSQAGGSAYQQGFVQHWLHRVLFFQAPLWVFGVAYTGFGALVALAWWRYPPRWR